MKRAASYNCVLVDNMSEDQAKDSLLETMELIALLTNTVLSHKGASNPTIIRLTQLLQKNGYIA